MRVIDFIQQKADCMNERDYANVLNGLADAYGSALSKKGVRATDAKIEQTLLACFLVQEIKKSPSGGYMFKNDPGRIALIKNLRR